MWGTYHVARQNENRKTVLENFHSNFGACHGLRSTADWKTTPLCLRTSSCSDCMTICNQYCVRRTVENELLSTFKRTEVSVGASFAIESAEIV